VERLQVDRKVIITRPYRMIRDDRRLFLYFALLLVGLLTVAGLLLRSWVARTLEAENKVNLAFLDLSLRDRARFLGGILSDQWEREQTWPQDLEDFLTRNHADYNKDISMQVFSIRGELIAASANTPAATGLSPLAEPGMGWKSYETRPAEGRAVRLVTYPILSGVDTENGITFHGYAQAGLLMPDAVAAVGLFTRVLVPSLAVAGLLFLGVLKGAIWVANARLAKEAAQLRNSQQRFVADAAHELGTPLAVLRGEIELALRRERSGEDYRSALVSCREEMERLSRLAENLLSLATADAGRKLIHKEPCDPAAILARVQAKFALMAQEKGVALRSLPEEHSHLFQADPVAVEQVLDNLVSNALRHTPRGETVTLQVRSTAAKCLFTVRDTGEGIPSNHLPQLFERFHRVDNARNRSVGGAGLGLAIVKTLMEAHGGSVAVESELGKGTQFMCQFPA
jgi:signal transduction histidine kinase